MIDAALLLLAICSVESNLDPLAFNYQDGAGVNNHSFGLCQITYQTAREMGMPEEISCRRDFRPRHIRDGKSCSLFVKAINIKYASRYLEKQLTKYRGDIRKVISAYNAGHAIRSNVSYVNKVLERYSRGK